MYVSPRTRLAWMLSIQQSRFLTVYPLYGPQRNLEEQSHLAKRVGFLTLFCGSGGMRGLEIEDRVAGLIIQDVLQIDLARKRVLE